MLMYAAQSMLLEWLSIAIDCRGSAMQVGVFEIVAVPLFSGYAQLVPDSKSLLDAVTDNYPYWHAGVPLAAE